VADQKEDRPGGETKAIQQASASKLDYHDTPDTPGGYPITLKDAHDVFGRWLGAEYDTDALDATLAAVAVERLDGDPLWLLLISGPGNAKTETVQATDGIGAIVTSTISSAGALLSGTPIKERADNATGGLLRKLQPGGVLVVKDVTSILSMSGDARAEVLAALREVYDGRWSRNVGSNGGMTLEWSGRIALVGAVTSAWDRAHAVVSSMGDRFVLVRVDSTQGRLAAGRQAILNTGSEVRMRAELAQAVAGVIAGMDHTPTTVTEAEQEVLLAAANLVTLTRTAVEFDRNGHVADAHAPEMPTRFAKQLAQVVRGSVAIGKDRADALRLAIRCARDSMPPMRLAILDELANHPRSTTSDIRKRIDKPHNSVDRQLQALHMLGVVTVEEEPHGDRGGTKWFYSLSDDVDPRVLYSESFPNSAAHAPRPHRGEV
jgi:DNA-binding transcriptional ArsR family regulator